MTRFARASGSKASNARVPEDPTPWSHLKPKDFLKSRPRKSLPEPRKSITSENTITRDKISSGTKRKVKWTVSDYSDSELSTETESVNACADDCYKSRCQLNDAPVQTQRKKAKFNESRLLSSLQISRSPSKLQVSTAQSNESGHTSATYPELLPTKIKSRSGISHASYVDSDTKSLNNKGSLTNSGKSMIKVKLAPIEGTVDTYNETHSLSTNSQYLNHSTGEMYSAVDFIELADSLPDDKLCGRYITGLNRKNLLGLRDTLIAQRLSPDEIIKQVNFEKMKMMKEFKKKSCFYCFGNHVIKDCPDAKKQQDVCYACGSTEHRISKCPKKNKNDKFSYATCFICKEQGHISTACPDNPHGLYPYGGGCKECGEVTHFVKDCPKIMALKNKEKVIGHLMNSRNIDGLDDENEPAKKIFPPKKKRKIVKF